MNRFLFPRSTGPLLAALLLSVKIASCDSDGGSATSSPTPALGDPLPGLTPTQLAAFERGRVMFEKRFAPSEGLGPLYNATSCSSCHSAPVTGGSSELYRNFYIAKWDVGSGKPELADNLPGLPSAVVPAFGSGFDALATFTLEGGRHPIPDSIFVFPVISAQRNSIPIFGVGLFELVSDAAILANADPEDLDGDGISGRTNNDLLGLGRFGQKAQANNIEIFTRAPLKNQMGITTDPFLGSGGTVSFGHAAFLQGGGFDPDDATEDADGVPDPEMSADDLSDLIAFSRFLAPPQKKTFSEAAERGEITFDAIGCTKCHVPSLPSSKGPVEAFTDLLLHDMGPALADNINFGTPQASLTSPPHTGSEFRTQPLWGVSHFAPYLHDGRAGTLDEAISLHEGEAEAIRDAYLALPQSDRDDLIAFLEHL